MSLLRSSPKGEKVENCIVSFVSIFHKHASLKQPFKDLYLEILNFPTGLKRGITTPFLTLKTEMCSCE